MSTKVDLTGGLRTFYGTPAVASSGGVIDPVAQAVPTPALRKVREGRGTRFVGDANEIKRLGHPAGSLSCGGASGKNQRLASPPGGAYVNPESARSRSLIT